MILPISFDIPVLSTLMSLPVAPEELSAPPEDAPTVTFVASAPSAGEAIIKINPADFSKPATP